MPEQSDTVPTSADVLPEEDEPRLPARGGGIFGAVGAMDRAKRAVEHEKAVAATSALFDQDTEGAGVDDSTPEPDASAEVPAESTSEDPKPTEVILTRMAEVSADPDGMDAQLRSVKLREIQVQVGLMPDDELGRFCAFVVANGDQFEQRTTHYVVKLLLQRHPKVVDQDPALPGNILGGIARRVIEREYTWDNLVVRRGKARPTETTQEPSGEGGDEGASEVLDPEPPTSPEPPDPGDPTEDPILVVLRRQNAEMATLGF